MSMPLTTSSRFMLWMDGVGGFLVCEASRVTLGQAGTAEAEVPIMADISRRHATIVRDGEHYLLDPHRPSRVDGRTVAEPARLGRAAEIRLGAEAEGAVRATFCVPHVCGLSARLDLTSGHRLRPYADGVLLLADACIVGPAAECHVCTPQAARTAVLFRRPDGAIVFRSAGSYDVDGRRAADSTIITRSSKIRADDFAWQLEPL